ncbi:MAG: hypothetical protein GF335_04680 [Candidatus Moranbacteria bacterium]|nr:hypothetical protein [Candidatus Moranbacteria bacterium]
MPKKKTSSQNPRSAKKKQVKKRPAKAKVKTSFKAKAVARKSGKISKSSPKSKGKKFTGFLEILRNLKSSFGSGFVNFKAKIFNSQKKSVQAKKRDRQSLINFLTLIIHVCVHLSVFFIPLFFIPITYSPLELNKLLIFIVFLFIGTLACLIKGFVQAELKIKKPFFSIPILLFLLFYIISIIFSIYPPYGIWGFEGGEGISLLALGCFITFFYLISNNFKEKSSILFLLLNLLISSLFVFFISILQILGLIKFIGAYEKLFNPIGTIFDLAIFFCALFVLALGLFIEKNQDLSIRALSLFGMIMSFIMVSIVNFNFLWLILFFTLTFLTFKRLIKEKGRNIKPLSLPITIILISIIAFFVFQGKSFIPFKDLPTNTNNILPSWNSTIRVLVGAVKQSPWIGVGIGNYDYFYAQYKDPINESFRGTAMESKSYFLTLVSTGGALLGVSYLIIIFFFGYKFLNIALKDRLKIYDPIYNVWVFLSIVLFFYTFSVSVLFLWWFFAALLLALMKDSSGFIKEKNREKRIIIFRVLSLFLLIVFLSFSVFVILKFAKKYTGAYYYQKAFYIIENEKFDQHHLKEALRYAQKSAEFQKQSDNVHALLSEIYWLLAKQEIQQDKVYFTDEEKKYINENIDKAIQNLKLAIQKRPKDFTNYLKLANLNQNIIGLKSGVEDKALENYKKAKELNSNDAFIYNQIAKLYWAKYDRELFEIGEKNFGTVEEVPSSAKENLNKAKENLQKALEINPKSKVTRLMLTSVYETEGQIVKAIETMKENVNIYQDDYRLKLALSLMYYKDRKFGIAADYLQSILDKWDDYLDARFILGACYVYEENPDEAIEHFEIILRQNPNDEDLQNLINELKQDELESAKSIVDQKIQILHERLEEEFIQDEQFKTGIINLNSGIKN